jgi:hypothetical protein
MEITFKYGFTYMFNMVGMIKIISFTSCKIIDYALKVIPFVFKSTIVYNIQRTKLTINRLKMITNIDIKAHVIGKDICPLIKIIINIKKNNISFYN